MSGTKKISELVLGPALTGAEEFETATSGVSNKHNTAQIVSYVQTSGVLNMQQSYNNGSVINIGPAGTVIEINTTDPAGNTALAISDSDSNDALSVTTSDGGHLSSSYDLDLVNLSAQPEFAWYDYGPAKIFRWSREKISFRAGTSSTNQFDAVNIGQYSFAFGDDVIAAADNSFIVGKEATATSSATGAVVFSDASGGIFSTTTPNSFNVRAFGGIYLSTDVSSVVLGNLNSVNIVSISHTGMIFSGTARFIKSIIKTADDVNLLSNTAPEKIVLFNHLTALRYTSDIKKSIYFNIVRTNDVALNEDVLVEIVWSASDTSPGDVVFVITLGSTEIGSVIVSPTVTETVTDSASTVQNQMQQTTAITISSGFPAGIVTGVEFFRDVDNVLDTYSGDAQVAYVKFDILRNRLGG